VEAEGVEYSGRSVEDAIAKAEANLGVARGDLAIQVLSQGSRGVFGIGAEDARVLVRKLQPAPVPFDALSETPVTETAENQVFAGVDRAIEPGEPDDFEGEEAPQTVPGESSRNMPQEASRVLQEILSSMGFDAEVSVRSTETPVVLEVRGDNLGALIGRRGDNLSALQFMVNLILARGRRAWPRIVIDVENYRSRREDSLRALAERTAYRVQRNGRPFTLEAMPATDRRVIHLSLRDSDKVETYSIGEGPARRVVIAPKQETESQPALS
jgi:spoIIIJ-associated protein